MIAFLAMALMAVAAGLRFVPGSPLAAGRSGPGPAAGSIPSNQPTPTPPPAPLPFRSAAVTPDSVSTTGFLSWALMDRRSGTITGSANMAATTTTASMVKAWLAADYLSLAVAAGRTPTTAQLADLETMIRDSDNDAGERTYRANGGTVSIRRLISTCKLTDSSAVAGYWSNTVISAEDTVRMGACIADGTAAGPQWTPWLLDMMRKVRGVGDFGVRDVLPTAEKSTVAIKNGWLVRDEDNNWYVNCLAIGDTWVLAVLQRFPRQADWETDFAHTQKVCRDTAQLLLNPQAS